jgi:bidirectional [NiFe] hydrogenase diaphorase subunit
LSARCLGACGVAPVVVYDGQAAGSQTLEAARQRLKGWIEHGS